MSDLDKILLNELKEAKTIDELMKTTNMPYMIIENKIKNYMKNNYYIKKMFIDDTLKFVLRKDNDTIMRIRDNNSFHFVAIADTHLSSDGERFDLLYNVTDYLVKNNIHYLFIVGDFIEYNMISSKRKGGFLPRFNYPQKAIDYVIKKYPKDKNINVNILLGNHDYANEYEISMDLVKYLNENRLDFNVLGYKEGFVKFQDKMLLLHHPFDYDYKNRNHEVQELKNKVVSECGYDNSVMLLQGHLHKNIYRKQSNLSYINVGNLSGYDQDIFPAWDIKIDYKKTKGHDTIIKPLAVSEYNVSKTTEIYETLEKKLVKKK